MTLLRLVIFSSIAINLCSCAILNNYSQLKQEYDFVVVGGKIPPYPTPQP